MNETLRSTALLFFLLLSSGCYDSTQLLTLPDAQSPGDGGRARPDSGTADAPDSGGSPPGDAGVIPDRDATTPSDAGDRRDATTSGRCLQAGEWCELGTVCTASAPTAAGTCDPLPAPVPGSDDMGAIAVWDAAGAAVLEEAIYAGYETGEIFGEVCTDAADRTRIVSAPYTHCMHDIEGLRAAAPGSPATAIVYLDAYAPDETSRRFPIGAPSGLDACAPEGSATVEIWTGARWVIATSGYVDLERLPGAGDARYAVTLVAYDGAGATMRLTLLMRASYLWC
jgi:hypothetical protein